MSCAAHPTRLETDSLVDGGAAAPRTAGSGAGNVFINAKWTLNVNGLYQLPWGLEVAGNLFGKQGTPFPYFRAVALGQDGSHSVLVTPEVDSVRFADLWNLDLRLAKNVNAGGRRSLTLSADLFNVLNANTDLVRIRNLDASNFGRITQNLSPRIVRFGVRLHF